MTLKPLAACLGCPPTALPFAVPRCVSRMLALTDEENYMLKAVGWIVLIIFIIGLLVVLGVFKAIF